MVDKGKFDTSLIRELAAILRESDLGEVEIQQGDLRIRVSRPEGPVAAPAPTLMHVSPPPQQAAISPLSAATAAGLPPPHPATRPSHSVENHPGMIASPMVGTCYLSPEADAPPFVKVGDMVSEGQVLLLVEAMKTFNQVTAPKAGRITHILVSNEQPVEFGEPLIIIE